MALPTSCRPEPIDPFAALTETEKFWVRLDRPRENDVAVWSDAMLRSLIT